MAGLDLEVLYFRQHFMQPYRYLVIFVMGRMKDGINLHMYHPLMLKPLLKVYLTSHLHIANILSHKLLTNDKVGMVLCNGDTSGHSVSQTIAFGIINSGKT